MIAGILMAASLLQTSPALQAQPTQPLITYQGRLDQAGTDIDGPVDLVFSFFDAVSGGTQLAASFSANGVRVEQGYFTQDIPIPNLPNAFFFGDVWLEISVANPAGSGAFETLVPRQRVTPAPRALLAQYALVAESVDERALLWRERPGGSGNDIYYDRGNVLIGTTSGNHPLTVRGDGLAGDATAIWAGYDVAPTGGGVSSVIRAVAQNPIGDTRAIWATSNSFEGYAGYFEGGRNYFEGAIGVGTETPDSSVDIANNSATQTGVRVTNGNGGQGFIADLGGPSGAINSIGFRASTGPFSTGFRAETGSISTGFQADVGPGSTGFFAQVSDGTGVATVANGANAVGVVANANGASGIGVSARANSLTGNTIGVSGFSASASGVGVRGESSFNGVGVHAISPGGLALLADGNVSVNGTLIKSAGSFRIDHPLSPQTHYLSHSFVESPDMMNIYNGNVVTDRDGYAEVTLPEWFEALNRDFRYQLTVIASFAQAAIWEEVLDNRFVIRTTEPDTKVSWQVTGIRDDPYARAHPIEVEAPKPDNKQGQYQFSDWTIWADQ